MHKVKQILFNDLASWILLFRIRTIRFLYFGSLIYFISYELKLLSLRLRITSY